MQRRRKTEKYHNVIEGKAKPLQGNKLARCGNVENSGTKFALGKAKPSTTLPRLQIWKFQKKESGETQEDRKMAKGRKEGTKSRTSAEILAETSATAVLEMLQNMDGTAEAKKEAEEMEQKFATMLAAKQYIPEVALPAYETSVAIFGEMLKKAQEKANGTRTDAIALLRHVIRETWTNEEIATALRKHFVTNPAKEVQETLAESVQTPAENAE